MKMLPLATLLALALSGAAVLADDAAKQHDDHMATLAKAPAGAPLDASGGAPAVYTKAGDKPVTGTFFAAAKPRRGKPGVIVIHEWWGLNDEVRAKAKQLAAAGFSALAVDLYAGQGATEPEAARKLAGAVRADVPGVVANLAAAATYLKEVAGSGKIGVIGWCLGGGFALDLALARPDVVDAVVMYYGQVKTTAAELAALKVPVMGHFGGLDQGIPLPGVRTFRKLLKEKGVEGRILVYPQAGHAFSNPTRMETYRAEDAAQAWQKTVRFFGRHLVVRPPGAGKGGKASKGDAPAPAVEPAPAQR